MRRRERFLRRYLTTTWLPPREEGARLFQQRRRALGLSQYEMGRLLMWPRTTIASMEQGHNWNPFTVAVYDYALHTFETRLSHMTRGRTH